MEDTIRFFIDGVQVTAAAGQTVMKAADAAGIYIPRLCDTEGLKPQGSCRVCVVKMNGRTVASCTQPALADAVVESETDEIRNYRRDLVRMLFHEGNHLCPICEASGRCELQAMGYRLGITQATKYPYLQPVRPVDASHPDIVLDTNRCILCGRCIRASRDVDGKNVFEYVGRGIHKKVGVNGANLADTDASIDDKAININTCPVGCIIQKGRGFFAPIGKREFDQHPIGHQISRRRKETP
ncbi:MAG: (2Fe-2S)-binding protein [Gammaproteobacteria bacterium]|nr:(2Fe-2S)-binding protein [Gammaproteobacteria bacterium]